MAEQAEYSLSTASAEATSTVEPPPPSGDLHQQPPPQPPPKKKRCQPGMPDPDAEVIALSPKSLMATNRFVCEVCGKGFQRDQNLQLHRRGHNLPWKLRQRKDSAPPRKRVYVCPETSCVHHDPARALGDLTGIKKHFCRKHGEKKWKCERCSKKYAVQSDWKAHLKTCGTRQYHCDCGTVFSRRDSFITHRAFCDALALESTKVQTISAGSPAPEKSVVLSPGLSTSQNSEMQESTMGVTAATASINSPIIINNTSNNNNNNNNNNNGVVVFDNNTMFAPLSHSISQPQTSFLNNTTTNHPTTIFSINEPQQQQSLSLYHFPPNTPSTSTTTAAVVPAAMSATALLQKAAQMGSSSSSRGPTLFSPKPVDLGPTLGPPSDELGLGLISASGGDDDPGSMVGEPAGGFFESKPMTVDFLGLGTISPGTLSYFGDQIM